MYCTVEISLLIALFWDVAAEKLVRWVFLPLNNFAIFVLFATMQLTACAKEALFLFWIDY